MSLSCSPRVCLLVRSLVIWASRSGRCTQPVWSWVCRRALRGRARSRFGTLSTPARALPLMVTASGVSSRGEGSGFSVTRGRSAAPTRWRTCCITGGVRPVRCCLGVGSPGVWSLLIRTMRTTALDSMRISRPSSVRRRDRPNLRCGPVVTSWPPAQLPGLHINLRSRPPVADYRCGRCGWAVASTGGQIPALTTRINAHRRAECPASRKGL